MTLLAKGRCPYRSEQIVEKLNAAKHSNNLENEILEVFNGYEMDMYTIWSCRSFFRALPTEFYQNNMYLTPYRVIIEAMAGNVPMVKELLNGFGRDFSQLKASDFTTLDSVKIVLELVMPHLNNSEFLERVRFISSNMPDPLGGLALNACRASIINGFRDLTEFCPDMIGKRKSIEHQIYMIYGKNSKGIYDVALAEWKYETNQMFEALLILSGTIPSLEQEGDIRCLFVAYLLQMRILILNGQSKYSKELYDRIQKKITDNYYEELETSFYATLALNSCYEGNIDEIESWLENKAPNENKELFLMDMYALLVKMRCYLQTGRYMLTLLLSKRLIEILNQSFRPHDMCCLHILSAIACMKGGDEEHAIEEFETALEIGIPRGYLRVFADEGLMMLELLKLYKEKRVKTKTECDCYDDQIIRKIKSLALEIARRFPNYLESSKDAFNELTPTEATILKLMAKGLSNDSIADRLGKKTGTVKFHSANIYKKLTGENRQQAINVARDLGVV